MTAYVVIDLDVDNPEGFQEYLDGVVPLMERAGGRNVLTEPDTLVLEGDWRPSTLVIHEFPDRAAVQRFWDSPEYQPLKDIRRRHSRVRVVVGEND
ncbi:DUF1330 domain-containing protein [Catenuloplanes atrovinosus]|uniref:Uncharacterized protein (DUF1330 family) n=1 Tax=Catenuloplanes atrovinosus TaxID=137266 RepID=A0AAE3YR53_9ACTN|nr:DUF1330 domain-containing protein [Catenuloplanes atrovinosus]MDR7277126.1 uncharacterized protein (DUF1330 family) [Catenuloplanes atrovinosus]